jgi:hypothetical protein
LWKKEYQEEDDIGRYCKEIRNDIEETYEGILERNNHPLDVGFNQERMNTLV